MCVTKVKKDLYLQLEFLPSVTLLFLQNYSSSSATMKVYYQNINL